MNFSIYACVIYKNSVFKPSCAAGDYLFFSGDFMQTAGAHTFVPGTPMPSPLDIASKFNKIL